MKPSTKAALLKFCEYMDNISEIASDHFDMDLFMDHRGKDGHLSKSKDKKITKNDLLTCGTSACAMGWLAVSPVGRRLGIELYARRFYDTIDEHFLVKNQKLNGFSAAKTLFSDLSNDQICFLFGAHEDIETPKEWADRCRVFLALGGNPDHHMLSGVPGAQ